MYQRTRRQARQSHDFNSYWKHRRWGAVSRPKGGRYSADKEIRTYVPESTPMISVSLLVRPDTRGVTRLLVRLPLPFYPALPPIRRYSFPSDITQGSVDARGLPSAFPWREAPKTRVRGFLKRVGYVIQQHKHRKFECVNNESFLPGTEMAFVQVAAGVFQMRASQVMAPLVEEGQGHIGPSKSREIGGIRPLDLVGNCVVDPREVMQKDLADFYLQAAVSTKLSRCTPFYRLHRLCGSKISNVNVLYGARRGDLPDGDVREFMGTKLSWESLSKDLEAILRYRLLKDKDTVKSRLSSIRKTTLQVDVDILCRETFFITDDRSEQVVQGCKAVSLRTHRLRLECCPFLKRDFHWEVVDLDNWMKGNTFW